MELLDLDTNTVQGVYGQFPECRGSFADTKYVPTQEEQANFHVYLQANRHIVRLLDALQGVPGPRKWGREDHGSLLILPERHGSLREQVSIQASAHGTYAVTFWLPETSLPWLHCSASTVDANEAAKLVVDALSKCEQNLTPRSNPGNLQRILKDLDDIRRGTSPT